MVIEIPAYVVNKEKNCAVCVLQKRKGVTKGKMDTSYHPYWVGGYGINVRHCEEISWLRTLYFTTTSYLIPPHPSVIRKGKPFFVERYICALVRITITVTQSIST